MCNGNSLLAQDDLYIFSEGSMLTINYLPPNNSDLFKIVKLDISKEIEHGNLLEAVRMHRGTW